MATGFATLEIVLYQPNDVLERRINVESLAGYASELQEQCTRFFADAAVPELLEVVVGVRPGHSSRVWLVTTSRADQDRELQELRRRLGGLQPPQVQEGPVAFAIVGSIAGAERPAPQADEGSTVPMPREWREVVARLQGLVTIPDSLFESVWPETEEGASGRRSRRLTELLPALAQELERLLRHERRPDLASQVTGLRILDRCRCGDDFCATFSTADVPKPFPSPHYNVELDGEEGLLILDVVGERIVQVEVLYRPEVREALVRALP